MAGVAGAVGRTGVWVGGGIWRAGVGGGCGLTTIEGVGGAGEATFLACGGGGGVASLATSSTLTASGVARTASLEPLSLGLTGGAEGGRSIESLFGRPTFNLIVVGFGAVFSIVNSGGNLSTRLLYNSLKSNVRYSYSG